MLSTGVHFAQQAARPGRRSFLALLLTWTGAGLILTYYGAEVYGLRVIGQYAVLTGIAVALYLPQFFGPPPVRMAHGVLLAAGCLWLAMGLWGRRIAEPRAVHNGQLPSLGVPAPRSAPY